MDPQLWLATNFENLETLDRNWTMERYDFPQNVRSWIEENWIKVSDVCGGTYSKPDNILVNEKESATEGTATEGTVAEGTATEGTVAEEGVAEKAVETKQTAKSVAQMYKKNNYLVMDDLNKKAMAVMATQGMDAAVKHMFTDQDTGRQLSYGEMRMRYG